jgi:hypothetical protein
MTVPLGIDELVDRNDTNDPVELDEQPPQGPRRWQSSSLSLVSGYGPGPG